MIVAVFAFGAVLLATHLYGKPVFPNAFLIGVSIAVAIIPESLVAVVTLTMSLSMRKMAKEKAIVRKLAALESLGNITDICTDKTGTLTEGKMIVTMFWTDGKEYEVTQEGGASTIAGKFIHEKKTVTQLSESADLIVTIASLCNSSSITLPTKAPIDSTSASVIDIGTVSTSTAKPGEAVMFTSTGDPTEIALNVLSHKVNMKKSDLERNHYGSLIADFPFDSTIKRMTVVYEKISARTEHDKTYYVFTKGAPEGVMSLCSEVMGMTSMINAPIENGVIPLTLEHEEAIRHMNESMADKGLRVLCLAYKKIVVPLSEESTDLVKREVAENDLTFVGLVGIQDPPRAEVPYSIKVCEEAGIVVHMVTGDHPSTARAIAKQIGIIKEGDPDDVVMKATQFDVISDEDLKKMERLPLVIARCSPQTKVKMVKALHARKRHVAMTGDGVNDAPAIKQADVGIAMGKAGSDVTKEASHIILTDDDFSTIVMAIREGRRIFANIRKFVIHLLSANVAQLIALLIPQLMGRTSPINSTQILWLNLVTGTPPAISLGTEKASKSIMDKRKRPVNESLFNFETILDIIFYGALMAAIMLISYFTMTEWWLLKDEKEAGGVAFTVMTMMLLFHAYNCRHPRRSFYMDQFIYSWLLHLSILLGIGLQCLILYVPWINSVIFYQVGPGWEAWVIILIGCLTFMSAVEMYKCIKRMLVAIVRRCSGQTKYKKNPIKQEKNEVAEVTIAL
jgi:Na+-exporting ATPase